MPNETRQLALAYFAAVEAGALPDDLLAENFSAWTTTQGPLTKEQYQGAIPLLTKMTNGSVRFEIDSIIAEGDCAAAEARSTATLIDGTSYENTYVFIFKAEDGRLRSIAEHFNPIIVQEKLVPLIQQIMAGDGPKS